MRQAKLPQLSLNINSIQSQIDNCENSSKSQSSYSNLSSNQLFEIKNEEIQTKKFDDFQNNSEYFSISMKKCGRDYQEDRFQAISNLNSKNDQFFAVYDGHNSALISNILMSSLHKLIIENKNYSLNIQQAIMESFQQIDQEILKLQKKKSYEGGSTALCALIQNKQQIYIINCGDSIAALINKEKIIKLNKEHKVSDEKEKQRLILQGAVIIDRGQVERVNGEIALSRSIGDCKYKEFLIAEPEISQYTLTKDDLYLILATDGFWDNIQINMIPQYINQWKNIKSIQEKSQVNLNLSQYLQKIAEENQNQTKKDNMTIISIDLLAMSNN